MSRVKIADLKARLSRHLRAVRRGGSITVLDRETPIARIVPMDTEVSGVVIHMPKEAKGRLDSVPLPPRPAGLKSDVVALLLEERQFDR
jgi:prevent-host-death family protein